MCGITEAIGRGKDGSRLKGNGGSGGEKGRK